MSTTPPTYRRSRGKQVASRPAGARALDARPLVVSQTRVASLTANPANARVHSPQQIGQIARSIAAFGFNVPLLIDEARQVISGHGRLLAANELGLPTVPTIQLAHLTDAQKRAFAIAENRLVENATWDRALLAEHFVALAAVDLDFTLDVTGFELPDIDLLIQGEPASEAPDPDDAPLTLSPAVSRIGDIWRLGAHCIACGSALDPVDLRASLGNGARRRSYSPIRLTTCRSMAT